MSDMEYRVPDSIEPVIGWRAWQLARVDGELTLQACTRRSLWLPGQRMEATCDRDHDSLHIHKMVVELVADLRNHPELQLPNDLDRRMQDLIPPCEMCSCGLYAAYTIEGCMAGEVYGQINGWGKVIQGDTGLRCQFAYPKLLLAPDAFADQLRRRYPGVEVRAMSDRDMRVLPPVASSRTAKVQYPRIGLIPPASTSATANMLRHQQALRWRQLTQQQAQHNQSSWQQQMMILLNQQGSLHPGYEVQRNSDGLLEVKPKRKRKRFRRTFDPDSGDP